MTAWKSERLSLAITKQEMGAVRYVASRRKTAKGLLLRTMSLDAIVAEAKRLRTEPTHTWDTRRIP